MTGELSKILIGVLMISIVAIGLNSFYFHIAAANSVTVPTFNTTASDNVFIIDDKVKETSESFKIALETANPLQFVIATIQGASIITVFFSVPGMLAEMLGTIFSTFGIDPILSLVIVAVILITIFGLALSAFLKYPV